MGELTGQQAKYDGNALAVFHDVADEIMEDVKNGVRRYRELPLLHIFGQLGKGDGSAELEIVAEFQEEFLKV